MIERFNQLVKRHENIIDRLSPADKANLADTREAAEQAMRQTDSDGDEVSYVLNDFEDALKELEDHFLSKAQPVPTSPSVQLRTQFENVRRSVYMREFERAYRLLDDLQRTAPTPKKVAAIEKERQATQQAQRDVINEYLGWIDEALQSGDFANAEKWIASARQYALDDSHQTAIQKREQRIFQTRESDLEQLREKIEKALKDVQDNQASLPEDINTRVEKYDSLAKGRDKGNTVQRWREQIREIKNQSSIEKAIRDAERKCINLWHDGGEPNARAARNLVEELENKHGIHPEISRLKERARTEYDNARSFASQAVTSAVTGRFEELIANYEEKQKSGVKYVPRLRLARDEQGNLIIENNLLVFEPSNEIQITYIDTAISDLKSLAKTYARQKAEEKLVQAKMIVAQNPRQASEFLDETANLYLLTEEHKQRVEHYRQTTVNPAVKRRREAEKLRDGAEALDIFEGWQQLLEAIRTDLLVPGVVEVQERLRPRLRKRIEGDLSRLRRQLQPISHSLLGQTQAQQQYQDAIAQTTTWVTLIGIDAQLADLAASLDHFIKESKKAIDDYQYVAAQVEYIRENLKQRNFGQADGIFAQVKNRLGEEGIRMYPQLLEVQSALEIRGNIDGLIARIERETNRPFEQLSSYLQGQSPEVLSNLLTELESKQEFLDVVIILIKKIVMEREPS